MTPLQPAPVAVVSGANRGLGLEVCRQLADLGFSVVLGARDLEKGERAAATLAGRALRVERLDVASSGADGPEALANRLGRCDVLVNNAGVHYDDDERPTAVDFRIVREALETNAVGAWRLACALVPLLRQGRHPRIVNVSSGAGSLHDMGATAPAYSISKAALNAVTRALAADLRGTGVLVNAVCPGWVATDMGGAGGRPVADGARGIVWAATLPDDGPTGGFFRDGRPVPW